MSKYIYYIYNSTSINTGIQLNKCYVSIRRYIKSCMTLIMAEIYIPEASRMNPCRFAEKYEPWNFAERDRTRNMRQEIKNLREKVKLREVISCKCEWIWSWIWRKKKVTAHVLTSCLYVPPYLEYYFYVLSWEYSLLSSWSMHDFCATSSTFSYYSL